MIDFDNQNILNAILGVGAVRPQSTLNTGIGLGDNQASVGGQLPQMTNPLEQNIGYTGTTQRFFGQTPQFNANPMQTTSRHTPGRDSWSSNMGLDHSAILNSIGLGNRTGGQ